MAFFVVLRRADAALSIPLPEAFPTREAAISALSAASSSGSIVLDGEVFIADLGTAVPVLIMQPAAAASAPAEVEAPEIAEPPAEEPGILDEVEAEAAYAEYSPLEGLTDESTLAAALKRAATSLEDEGIVAPDSIESAPEEAAAEAAESAAPESESAEQPEPAAEQSWPWANVEAYTGPEGDAADDDQVSEESSEADEPLAEATPPAEDGAIAEAVAEPLGVAEDVEPQIAGDLYELADTSAAPIADDAPIITSAPLAGEEAYVPRPVILGDYADAPATVIEEPEPSPELEEPEEPAPASELVHASGQDLEVEEALEPEEPTLGEPSDDAGDDLSALVAEATAMGGYEAAGELNLAEYTCQDCVYANTCPKVGEASPADCGSFQWRSA